MQPGNRRAAVQRREVQLERVSHRPFPLPRGRWIWRQRWDSVLLPHFRVEAAGIRALAPPQLTLEEADGSAWVSVVPFRMCNVRPRYLPAIGPFSNFAELNIRTYVRAEGKPGRCRQAVPLDNSGLI
jgi:uncharacterized protein YqjF (DUF2071 family)